MDRINYRVMSAVYSDIQGGWKVKQKIREQVDVVLCEETFGEGVCAVSTGFQP